ncbi:MAG: glycosyltransferase involved in cell wall biosynthesis [Cognaticolwellia sp.]|jgi:glycosyltransferase involved in cell wall biosynthesis
MLTAVLIPARNEGPRLAEVLAEVRRVQPQAQLWVIDGQSQDDTVQVAQACGAQVLQQAGKGYAAALATGYQALANSGVERAVQLDADGQHPPAAIPRLLRCLDQADLVFASRQGTSSGGPWSRRAGNAALAAVVRQRTGLDLHDVMSGFWATNAHAIQTLAQILAPGCADANVRIASWRAGLRLHEAPVAMPERSGGHSMHQGWAGARNFALSLWAAGEA